MTKKIVLVGGLPQDPDYQSVIKLLSDRSGSVVEWGWVRATLATGYRPGNKYLQALATQLKQAADPDQLRVVKLYLLNGHTQNFIYENCSAPVLMPDVESLTAAVDWLLSPAANLVPHQKWYGNENEAALVALLAKLIRNKSWNKDLHGHRWTTNEDLLTQSPVLRPKFQRVAVKAHELITQFKDVLFIEKGGTRGTSHEWSIDSRYLPQVKQAIITQSFNPLAEDAVLSWLVRPLLHDSNRQYRIDGEIVGEKVRRYCEDRE